MSIFGSDNLKAASDRLKLPKWWIESLAIEYLPCRRFCLNDKMWTFDFGLIDDELFDSLKNKKVVIPHYTLYQNISPEDFAYRSAKILAGWSDFTFENVDNFIPEGVTNNTMFPLIHNSIKIWDPKLGFGFHAVVFDKGNFYQWKIAETLRLQNKNYVWYKSDFLDLKPLQGIYEQLIYWLNNFRKNESIARDKVSVLYEKLEEVRAPLRRKIITYHNKKKSDFAKPGLVNRPPLHSFFDNVKLEKDGFKVESHLEPLFYRSVLRNLDLALKARERIKNPEQKFEGIIDEIEYSITCIIMNVNCLESYINYVITKYLPEESKVFIEKQSTLRQKWLWISATLDIPRFVVTKPPFLHFTELIQWRNAATHNSPEYKKVKKYKADGIDDDIGEAYSVFNVEHAKRSALITKEMILYLSKNNQIPIPKWINLAPSYY